MKQKTEMAEVGTMNSNPSDVLLDFLHSYRFASNTMRLEAAKNMALYLRRRAIGARGFAKKASSQENPDRYSIRMARKQATLYMDAAKLLETYCEANGN